MQQDCVSFTKNIDQPDIVNYVKAYFDENMAMFGIVSTYCEDSKVSAFFDNDILIYTLTIDKEVDVKFLKERISSLVPTLYGHVYRTKVSVKGKKKLEIELTDTRATEL